MKNWEIWVEGYLCTGMEGIPEKARRLGVVKAETFKEACIKFNSEKNKNEEFGNFDVDKLSLWGCTLFDNELDARKFLG